MSHVAAGAISLGLLGPVRVTDAPVMQSPGGNKWLFKLKSGLLGLFDYRA